MSFQVVIPRAVVHSGIIYNPGTATLANEEDAELVAKAAGVDIEEIVEVEEGAEDTAAAAATREEELKKLPVATLRDMAKEHGISPSQPKSALVVALAAKGA